MFVKKTFNYQIFFIFSIFCLSLIIRLFNINWDQGQHLHPDERFLTMVESTIKLPNSLSQYLNTGDSPLNPYNYKEFQFFVYGTFPIFLIKYISNFINMGEYHQVYLVGRFFSAFFDSLNIIGIYLFMKFLIKEKKNKFIVLLPSFLYAFCVLPIQLSHFFAVDTFLTPILLFTFIFLVYWISKRKIIFLLIAAVLFGLGLSTKISAYLFSPVILLFFIYHFFTTKNKIQTLYLSIIFSLISLTIFRFFQPYAFVGLFKINPIFVENMVYLKSMLTNKNVFYPPEIQWLSKTPLIYPLYNILVWGLGLPLSLILFLKIKKTTNPFVVFCIIFWILFLFIQQGLQFTHTMRYFLPIYPFIFVLVGLIFQNHFSKKILFILLSLHVIYCLFFISIYTRPHSRIQASNWIYKNIPSESKIANEYWDDPLPLYLDSSNFYSNQTLDLYSPDTQEKWQKINSILEDTDYLFLSSNRLWSSIPSVPKKYPLATKYYQDLFDGNSNFKKIIEFNSYPGISLPFLNKCFYFGPTNFPYSQNENKWFEVNKSCLYPGIYLRDDVAEEAFSVYDHPKVIIFKKMIN
ncbi:MAG: glycosyltransferase family 39 protein [Candidatus Shapirobacteria bacterium]|jgi:hypothetical protein|nr:glycosyltransferase family 39 protein [Candidatus Shapirobacteria bacterium]